jgi:hypothetical protein
VVIRVEEHELALKSITEHRNIAYITVTTQFGVTGTELRSQRAEGREQRAESREQRAESREQRAESKE